MSDVASANLRTRILRVSGEIAAPRERVFAVVEDARTANQIGPAYLALEVLRSPWLPKPGERTRLRVTLRGVGFELETELAEYRRGNFLLERQVAGPFASLEHAVSVEESALGARLTEVLAYQLPLGLLGRLFDRVALRSDLDRLLHTRLARVRALLEPALSGDTP